MSEKFGDFSYWNYSDLNFFKNLKSKGMRGAIVKTTEGTYYTNNKAPEQFINCIKVFGNCGLYHFITDEPVAEAHKFMNYIENNLKADKDTFVGVDVEPSGNNYHSITFVKDVTETINKFLDELVKNGYENLIVYANYSWFTGKINIKRLRHDPYIWLANYDAKEPGIDGVDFWQFSNHWNGVDCSDDFNNVITHNKIKNKKAEKPAVKPKPEPATYWQYGKMFKLKSDLAIYADENLKHKTKGIYKAGSIIYIQRVTKPNGADKELSRFQVENGYISANTKFSTRVNIDN